MQQDTSASGRRGVKMGLNESEVTEFKTSTAELDDAITSITAILNKHQKGELYFGIKNNGDVVGQQVSDKTLRDISKSISDHIEPKIFPKIENVSVNGKQCIYLKFEGKEVPYFAFGKAYVRTGTENKQISAKELENLIIRKNMGKMRWDNQLCREATLKDIDVRAIKKFIEMAKQSGRLNIYNESTEQILSKLNLIKKGNITNAAIVLFGKEPKRFFNNSIVKCGRFRGELKEEFFDIRDLEGNIFKNIDDSIGFLKDHLRLTAKIEGLVRKEKWEIPIEALREAVINALIHRDYFSNSFTYIKLYDSKILISNPGKLPNGLVIKDLYKEHESIPKNPLLAETLYYTGLIDVWGRGIQNILDMLKIEGLTKPKFEESAGSFRIIFNRLQIDNKNADLDAPESAPESAPEKLIEVQQTIISEILKNNKITYDELALITQRDRATVMRNISKLKKKEMLKRVGPDKGGHWEIINNSLNEDNNKKGKNDK